MAKPDLLGQRFDAVVIGSGPGGLTAALALARAGQRVLVLEQHYLPGGWTHGFSLEGHHFSPGVHYVGDLGPGGGLRRVYESLGLSEDLAFVEMNPDGFDHFLIEGERFDQPRGADAWRSKLQARFPAEAKGIAKYFEVIQGVAADLARCDELLGFPRVLALPWRAPKLARWAMSTLGSLLDSTIRDPLLRGVLSAQCGNHGLAPSRVSLPLHAGMTSHYFGGAFYPRGGAKRIPAAYIKAIRRLGGEIALETPVTRIVTEGKRAVGVEIASSPYDRFKDGIAAKMLDAAEDVIPGIRSNLVFASVGTPLTNAHYCRSFRGAMYGAAKTPWQLGPFSFSSRGPVEGLHLCGASILSHGVAGATMSGLAAARDVLGLRAVDEIVGAGDGSLEVTLADPPRRASVLRDEQHHVPLVDVA